VASTLIFQWYLLDNSAITAHLSASYDSSSPLAIADKRTSRQSSHRQRQEVVVALSLFRKQVQRFANALIRVQRLSLGFSLVAHLNGLNG
jgi:hypothetical protein